jgi:hypothetical protein
MHCRSSLALGSLETLRATCTAPPDRLSRQFGLENPAKKTYPWAPLKLAGRVQQKDVFIPRQLNLPGTLTMVNYSLVFSFRKKLHKKLHGCNGASEGDIDKY